MMVAAFFLWVAATQLELGQICGDVPNTCITLDQALRLDPLQLPAGCTLAVVGFDNGATEPIMTCVPVNPVLVDCAMGLNCSE